MTTQLPPRLYMGELTTFGFTSIIELEVIDEILDMRVVCPELSYDVNVTNIPYKCDDNSVTLVDYVPGHTLHDEFEEMSSSLEDIIFDPVSTSLEITLYNWLIGYMYVHLEPSTDHTPEDVVVESEPASCDIPSCDDAPNSDGDLLPLFFMHGATADRCSAETLFRVLNTTARPRYLCSIPLFEGEESLRTDLKTQGEQVANFIQNYTTRFQLDKIQLVCYSMGAMLCRIVLQQMNDHHVSNIVFLAGALAGVYGEVWNTLYDSMDHTEYDAFHDLWREESVTALGNGLISVLDGAQMADESSSDVEARRYQYKSNWQKVDTFTSFASPADRIVVPWQTAHFKFFAESSGTDEIDSLVADTLGLRSMISSQRLTLRSVPDVSHFDWVGSEAIIRDHVLPALTTSLRMVM